MTEAYTINERTVGTYNIAITRDPQVARGFFNVKNAWKGLNIFRDSADSYLMTNNDLNFASLTHEFNHGNPQGGADVKISLKTYDLGLQIFTNLFDQTITKAMRDFVASKNLEQQRLAQLADIKAMEDEKKLQNDYQESDPAFARSAAFATSETERVRLNGGGAGRTSKSGLDFPDEFPMVAAEVSDKLQQSWDEKIQGFENNIEDRVNTFLKSKGQPKFFITYGVGNDTKDWAGPFECYLGGLKYDNNGRKEAVTYEFVIDLTHNQRLEVADTSPQEDEFVSTEYTIPILAFDSVNKKPTRVYQTPTLHDAIVKSISNYLFNMGIHNHLIVLPNLDMLLAPALATYKKTILKEKRGPAPTEEQLARQQRDQREADAYAAVDAILNPNNWGSSTKNYLSTIKQFFKDLGLGVSTVAPGSREDSDPVAVRGENEEGGVTGSTKKANPIISMDNPFGYGDTEKILAHCIVSLGFNQANESGPNDYMAPVRDLMKNLIGSSDTVSFEPVGFFETDLRLKDELIKQFGSGTFTGYKQKELKKANKNQNQATTNPDGSLSIGQSIVTPPVTHDDSPYFIFGDRNLINLFVYGDIKYVQQTDDRYYDLGFIADTGNVPLSNKSPLEDPFWSRIRSYIKLNAAGVELQDDYFARMQALRTKNEKYNLGFYLNASEKDNFVNFLSDEFGFIDNEEAVGSIYDQAVPLFIANAKNANLLSYSFDANKYLFAQFFGTINEVFARTVRRYLSSANPIITSTMSDSEIIKKIYSILSSWGGSNGGFGKDFSKLFGPATAEDKLSIAVSLKDLLLLETTGTFIRNKKGRSSSISGILNLFVNLFEREYIGGVTALPMFNLSTASIITKPAILLAKSTRKVEPHTLGKTRRSPSLDIFSGLYKILGFKHTISSNKAQSEFTMVKDMRSTLNNEVG